MACDIDMWLQAPVTFGPFRLEPADERLWRGDEVVPLTPRAFAVLSMLVAHAGRLVTKDELLQALWRDVHVGDAALKVAVREVRRALDDDPREPLYIATAHRRGYRFVAPVASVPVASVPAPLPGRAPLPHGLAAMPVPEVRYATSGDVNIAYQVVGEGPIDLVFVMGWVSHLESFWTEPLFARFLLRLASFSRLILFDKRGTGLSDRVSVLPTLEQRMHDVRAVMQAVGSTRAALLGVSEGGPMSALFAATYPEKTLALVMIGTYAKRLWDPEYPWAPTLEERERFFEEIREQWGGPVGLEARAPSLAHDPAFRAWWASYLRMGASPGAALTLTRMNAEIDVRHVLPSIRVPTLVLHRVDDRCLRVEEGRYVASRIPGARFVELPGADHLPFVGDQDAMLDEIEEFLTGFRREAALDARVLATVLTVRYAADGSSLPTEVQERLRASTLTEIEWFGGRGASLRSSGARAAFDGPARAIRCACALVTASKRMGQPVRIGLHTGECDRLDGQVEGLAVTVSDAIASAAGEHEVLASRTVKDLVAGSGLRFADRGVRDLGDPAGTWRLFAVDC